MVRNNHEEQESPWAGICGLADSRMGDGGSGSKGRWQGLKRRLLRECPSGPSWTFILRVRLYISSMAVSWNSVAMKCPDPTPEQWDESEFWGSPTPLNHVHAKLEKRQHEVSLPRVSVFSCPTSEKGHWLSWSCVLNETPPKGVERVSPRIPQKGILLYSHFLWKETSLPWRKERHSLLTRPRKLRKPQES